MICGWNDWDDLLEEARVRALLKSLDVAPVLLKASDYGTSVLFTLDELLGRNSDG